jgi:spore coat polysaccharide biosynthesis predicted glycosyltransferase SpsG
VRVLVRCDAGPSVGLGHAGRALALAEELGARLDVRPTFLSRRDRVLEAFLGGREVDLRPVVGPGYAAPEVLEAIGHDEVVVVSDTYDLDSEALARVAATGAAHVVVDDFARLDEWPCEVLVNPNVGADASAYAGPGRVLTGPRHALVRREIRDAAARRKRRPEATRLLVTLGGGTEVWTRGGAGLVAALEPVARAGIEVRVAGPLVPAAPFVAVPPASLPQQLAWADAALLAGGVVKYEAAAAGVPMLLVAAVEHQREVAAAFAATGAAEFLGAVWEIEAAAVAAAARDLLGDRSRREALSDAARTLVDGRGAARVVAALLGEGDD